MRQMFLILPVLGLFFIEAFAQNIATPMFVQKDGDATAIGYSGTDKLIIVDGGSQQSTGWITFQTEGIDVTKIKSASLALYVNSLTNPGTLQVRSLLSDITAPENNVRLSSIAADTSISASQTLGTADIEKVIRIDLTDAVKSGTFKGVVLTSDDGLRVAFDTKEGHLAPLIMLTNSVDDVAAKWHSGSAVPGESIGKNGDYYLETTKGEVYSKTSGAWAVVTNITGAMGARGDQGPIGNKGETGNDGISIEWIGSFSSAPSNPQLNQAYHNTLDGNAYLWNGDQWALMVSSVHFHSSLHAEDGSPIDALSVDSDGNVTIDKTLEVQTAIHVKKASSKTADHSLHIENDSGSILFNPSSANAASNQLTMDNDQQLIFSGRALVIGPQSSQSRGMRIDSTGNVGIGIQQPAEKLEVNGKVVAESFSGDGSMLSNVTATTLSDGSVTSIKIAAGAVDSFSIAASTIGSTKIAPNAISGSHLQNSQVTSAHLRDGAALDEIIDDDGAGSGLDADLLDGLHASDIIEAAADEVRTPISTVPYTISTSGSYYLSANLTSSSTTTHAITINVSNVTIDLMGFSLTGPGNTLTVNVSGIFLSGRRNVTIKNGTIQNFPGYGIIEQTSSTGQNHTIENIKCLSNRMTGIVLGGEHHSVTGCLVADNGAFGISTGSYCIFEKNIARDNMRDGFRADGSGCIIRNNVAEHNGENGFLCGYSSVVTHNTASSNGDHGFYIYNCNFTNNTAYNNGTDWVSGDTDDGNGVHMSTSSTYSSCIIVNNVITHNYGYGLYLSTGCLVDGNSIYYNNYAASTYTNVRNYTGTVYGLNYMPTP